MNTRRHGLMRPRGAARVIASVLAFGLVASVAWGFVSQAGAGMWGVALLVLLIFGLPVLALRSRR